MRSTVNLGLRLSLTTSDTRVAWPRAPLAPIRSPPRGPRYYYISVFIRAIPRDSTYLSIICRLSRTERRRRRRP